MATSVENATLTVTVKEQLYLNGKDRGSETTHTFNFVDEVMSFIKTCPDDASTLLFTFDTTPATTASNLVVGDVKYIRLTNLDTSVDCEIVLTEPTAAGGSQNAIHKLGPGQSYILMTGVDNTFKIGTALTGGSATASMADITAIEAHCYDGAVDIEVFVASV